MGLKKYKKARAKPVLSSEGSVGFGPTAPPAGFAPVGA
jgi:hypothetical protein